MVILFLETRAMEITLYANIAHMKTFVTLLHVLVKTEEGPQYQQ